MSKRPPQKFKKTTQGKTSELQQVSLLKKAVADTLRYRQIFDTPMNYYQIWNYLCGGKHTIHANLQKELDMLIQEQKVTEENGWFSWSKCNFSAAEKRRQRAEKLLKKAEVVTGYLKHIPWIQMVAVTGSVAAYNADEKADVDLFIVTKPRRLYLSRLFLVVILKILGVYWNPKKPAGTICPNILTTDTNLAWNDHKRNLYIANEISLLYPLFSRENCYFKFLTQNAWVTHFLPNLVITEYIPFKNTGSDTFFRRIVNMFEEIARKMQFNYMGNKRTTEIVQVDFIHFNINDSSIRVLNTFHKEHI